MSLPRLLLTGAQGQLGTTIQQHWESSGCADLYELVTVDIEQLNLLDSADTLAYLSRCQPEIIINAAAYTQVDRAEDERETAFQLNDAAVGTLVSWCQLQQARLIHVSTDFVFDGRSKTPYAPQHLPHPLSVYGASKAQGEEKVIRGLPETGSVIRTSWLYSEYGSNFVKTMLRLMREKDALSIVDDQIGSPTSTHSLALFIGHLVRHGPRRGIFHWTDGGEISWYDFAMEIQSLAYASGYLTRQICLTPVSTAQYPTRAVRPSYSVLDREASLALLNDSPQVWQSALAEVISVLTSSDQNARL